MKLEVSEDKKEVERDAIDDVNVEVEKAHEVSDVVRQVVELGLQKDAFFVADEQKLTTNLSTWSTKLPAVTPIHVVTVNACPWLLDILSRKIGAKFVCNSRQEMDRVLSCNIDASSIIFGNNASTASNLKNAAANKVGWIIFRTLTDLKKIQKSAPEANLLMSISPGGSTDTNVHMWLEMLTLSKELGLNVVGVGFNYDEVDVVDYTKMMALARAVFVVGQSVGHLIKVIDVGQMKFGRHFELEATSLQQSFIKHFGDCEDINMPKLLSHVPESIIASAFVLATRIIGKRMCRGREKQWLFVNDGIFNSFKRLLAFDGVEFVPELVRCQVGRSVATTIFGPSGHDFDILADGCLLDSTIDENEWIVFPDMGAYSIGPDDNMAKMVLTAGSGHHWFIMNQKKQSSILDLKKVDLGLHVLPDEPLIVYLSSDDDFERVELFRQLPHLEDLANGNLTAIQ